jgi:hypothetical protein
LDTAVAAWVVFDFMALLVAANFVVLSCLVLPPD